MELGFGIGIVMAPSFLSAPFPVGLRATLEKRVVFPRSWNEFPRLPPAGTGKELFRFPAPLEVKLPAGIFLPY